MIEEIKQSNIIEYIKKMPLEDRIAINNELCNFDKSDAMYLLEVNKALVEALENLHNSCMVPQLIHFFDKQDSINYKRYYDEAQKLLDSLTTYKGENTL